MQGTPLAATSKINRMTRQITLATLTPRFLLAFDSNHAAAPVSYTHLTLPTKA